VGEGGSMKISENVLDAKIRCAGFRNENELKNYLFFGKDLMKKKNIKITNIVPRQKDNKEFIIYISLQGYDYTLNLSFSNNFKVSWVSCHETMDFIHFHDDKERCFFLEISKGGS
jgi:hypothetical protein